jgi:hypothetical protein
MNKVFRRWLSLFFTLCLCLITTTSAFAFTPLGGCLNYPPYYKYYWSISHESIPGVNPIAEVDEAMKRWNNTENTKVWMFKTSNRPSSIIDFIIHPFYDGNIMGVTHFYRNSTLVNPTNSNWSWCEIRINSSFDWKKVKDPNGKIYPHMVFSATAAHEIGHAFGLEDLYWPWEGNRLMYHSISFYQNYGVYGPTTDEVKGVRSIYGPLY